MSFQLYVGNYPTEFSRKDVANVFRDFDGIQLIKFFRKETKCYSFLLCKDMDQVVSVIRQMNNTFVSGRQLIVRASDQKLQEYVELLLQEIGDDIEVAQKPDYGADEKQLENSGFEVNTRKYKQSKSVDSPPFVPLQVLRNKASHRGASGTNSHEQFDKNSCHSSSLSVSNQFYEHTYVDAAGNDEVASPRSNYSNNNSFHRHHDFDSKLPLQVLRSKTSHRGAYGRNSHEQFEKNYRRSSSSSVNNQFYEHNYVEAAGSSETESVSPRSNYSDKNSFERHQDSEFTWVSVTNFPLGTSIRSIYKLFSDFKPVNVRMICNEARKDKTLTEAHVCFRNRDIAEDVILNFDNTMFDGRLLLVNDTQDLTVMNELLNVLHL